MPLGRWARNDTVTISNTSLLSCRHNGQDHMGWVSGIMIDRIVGHYHSPVLPKWLPGVRVHVESRKVATRDINPDAVSLLEHVPVGNGSITNS